MEKKSGNDYILTLRQNEILKQKLETSYVTIAVVLLLAFLLGAGWFFCNTAHAGGFVEVGQSRFTRPDNYTWWQEPYPHEFQTNSNYLRVGYEGKPQKVLWGNVTGRVSGFDLGHYKTKALATSDEVWLADGRCNVSTCTPPDYYETRGSVRGLLFSGVYRKWNMFFEGGASITRQKFWLYTRTLNNLGRNGPVGTTQHFSDTHTAIGYMAAVGFEHKNFTFAFAYWLNKNSSKFYGIGGYTPGIDVVKTFAIGWRF